MSIRPDPLLFGLAAGALTGTLAGALIGGKTRVWIRLYPHR